MTRKRIFGEDKPFCDWIRSQEDLDSESGFVATDSDLIIHRYMTVCDKAGERGTVQTREVQAMMLVEVKTRDGEPTDSQRDTLAKFNMFAGPKKTDSFYLRNMGVAFVSLSGTTPENSERIRWGRFLFNDDPYKILWREITKNQLIDLLSFAIHPDNFCTNPFRRHHAKKEISAQEFTEMGFNVEVKVFRRS